MSSDPAPIRVLLVEDERILRDLLKDEIGESPRIEVIGEAGNGADALEQASELQPDVVVLDLNLPDMNGLQVIRELSNSGLESKILVLTGFGPSRAAESLRAGATGYLAKSADAETLIETIQTVAGGRTSIPEELRDQVVEDLIKADHTPSLSTREAEVLQLLAEGDTANAIAEKLQVSDETVRTYVRRLRTKLAAKTQAEAVAKALRLGLLR